MFKFLRRKKDNTVSNVSADNASNNKQINPSVEVGSNLTPENHDDVFSISDTVVEKALSSDITCDSNLQTAKTNSDENSPLSDEYPPVSDEHSSLSKVACYQKELIQHSESFQASEFLHDQQVVQNPESPRGFFSRLKKSLSKTRKNFTENLATLILGRKTIDQHLLDEIEEQLIIADIGVSATEKVIEEVTQKLKRKEINDPELLMTAIKTSLEEILIPCEKPLIINEAKKPYVILVVGVNGVGKTTTIGKISHYFKQQGLRVLLAAGDTFRAAAISQLEVWGERNDIAVVAQQPGSDSASVIFDAIQAAKARNIDIVIADTAGRLHTQNNLMEELKKIKRVMAKSDIEAPHEVLLVLDSVTGQNGLNQALQFHDAVQLTGLVLTKLDGTAKGGVIFAIAQTLKIPIRFIGIGEGINDLRPFQAKDFVEALFSHYDDSI